LASLSAFVSPLITRMPPSSSTCTSSSFFTPGSSTLTIKVLSFSKSSSRGARGDDWWRDVPGVYELSIETSPDWRRLAHALLGFTLEAPWIEHLILVAMGLDWHWDLEGAGLDATGYRELLRSMFAQPGFRAVHTTEPNVAMHASNLVLARVGQDVRRERRPGRGTVHRAVASACHYARRPTWRTVTAVTPER
jgi:hypothetical protein